MKFYKSIFALQEALHGIENNDLRRLKMELKITDELFIPLSGAILEQELFPMLNKRAILFKKFKRTGGIIYVSNCNYNCSISNIGKFIIYYS
ncbi:hypothetical protein JOC34_003421 [Virgibacillus halotolerans]|nr:hypothetical protein [Virgibacillus halotolerans]